MSIKQARADLKQDAIAEINSWISDLDDCDDNALEFCMYHIFVWLKTLKRFEEEGY